MDFLSNLLVAGVCIVVLLLIARLISIPMRLVKKIVWNSVIGFVMLSLLNLFGEVLFGFSVQISLLSSVIAGFFGIPGVLILVVVTLLF